MAADTERKITLVSSGGLLLFVVIALIALVTTQRLVRDGRSVNRTYQVRGELRSLDAELRNADADARSFLLTGDSSYVVRVRASTDRAQALLLALRRLTVDDPAQRARFHSLHPMLVERLRRFHAALELAPMARRDGEAARPPSQLVGGELVSSRVGSAIASLDSAEEALLSSRTAAQRTSEWMARLIVLAFAVFGGGLAWALRRSIRRDRDRRTRIEEALRESEAKFSGILSIAADAIISIDAAWKIVHFNHGAEQIFGYRESEVLGLPIDLLLPERFAEAHRGHITAFAGAPETARRMGERRQVLGRRHDGEEFPADASISRLATPRGPLFTVVLRDVTTQQRFERHEHLLAEAGRRLVATLDYDALLRVVAALPVPAIGDWCVLDVLEESDVSASGVRRVVSRHAVPEVDVALSAIEARGLSEDSPSRVLDVMRTGIAELVTDVSDEWIESHALPEELPFMRALEVRSMLLVPLLTGERVVGAVSIGAGRARRPLDSADLALVQAFADRASPAIENARNYRAAQRATAARKEVLSVVSHDLRNPLNGIRICARTLLDNPPAEESERRALYRSMLDATTWMHRLIQDLMDAASIDAGRMSVELELQSVSPLLDECVQIFAARAAAQHVRLATDVDPETPLVQADRTRVVQALANLVGNALKYTPAGGTVTLGATPRGTEALLWVRDTGVGIAPIHLPHIFERFWHLRGASGTRGTGLGLAIVQGIVAAHGGRIWAESAPGAGSTFLFTLRVADASPAPLSLPDDACRPEDAVSL